MLPSRPSTAELVTEEEQKELEEWMVTTNGPWKSDLQAYGAKCEDCLPLEEIIKVRVAEKGCPESLIPTIAEQIVSARLYRNDYLAWCGSVEVSEKHPWHGEKVSGLEKKLTKSPHGGLSEGVTNGRPNIFGFDCNHRGDAVPFASFVNEKNDKKRGGKGIGAGLALGSSGSQSMGLPKAGGLKLPGQDTDWNPVMITRGVYRDHAYSKAQLDSFLSQCIDAAIKKAEQ